MSCTLRRGFTMVRHTNSSGTVCCVAPHSTTDCHDMRHPCTVVAGILTWNIAFMRGAGFTPLMSSDATLMVEGPPSISSRSRSSFKASLPSASNPLPPKITTKRFWVQAADAPLRAAGVGPLRIGSTQAKAPWQSLELSVINKKMNAT